MKQPLGVLLSLFKYHSFLFLIRIAVDISIHIFPSYNQRLSYSILNQSVN